MQKETKWAIKINTIPVPYEIHRILRSLATSSVPTTYNIIPELGCVGKIDVYSGEQLMW